MEKITITGHCEIVQAEKAGDEGELEQGAGHAPGQAGRAHV